MYIMLVFFGENEGGTLFLQAKILCLGVEYFTITLADDLLRPGKAPAYLPRPWVLADAFLDIDGFKHIKQMLGPRIRHSARYFFGRGLGKSAPMPIKAAPTPI